MIGTYISPEAWERWNEFCTDHPVGCFVVIGLMLLVSIVGAIDSMNR